MPDVHTLIDSAALAAVTAYLLQAVKPLVERLPWCRGADTLAHDLTIRAVGGLIATLAAAAYAFYVSGFDPIALTTPASWKAYIGLAAAAIGIAHFLYTGLNKKDVAKDVAMPAMPIPAAVEAPASLVAPHADPAATRPVANPLEEILQPTMLLPAVAPGAEAPRRYADGSSI